jgi:hypothetical protein
MNLSPHFTLDELTIRRGVKGADAHKVTPAIRAQLVRLCSALEAVRSEVGEAVHVTSGFRSGDPKQHGAGLAADIQVRSMSPLDLIATIRRLSDGLQLSPRQVIAESLHTDKASLSRPMLEGSGLWVHVAIFGPGYMSPTRSAWLTSTAPVSGSRVFVGWMP